MQNLKPGTLVALCLTLAACKPEVKPGPAVKPRPPAVIKAPASICRADRTRRLTMAVRVEMLRPERTMSTR